jgi:DNA (cytosine-5)-methyltransferase 1
VRVGSLFAGIGGFDLGFERCGMQTVWQVEREPYRRAVLAQHFPGATRYDDVRTVNAGILAPIDLLCGGFPCTDLSYAGKGAGLAGEQSGLWSEFSRLIGELRPDYVVVENVPALLARGFGRVLGDLAALGYDTEWDCLPAASFGAPHLRDRLWVIAYPDADSCRRSSSAKCDSRPEGEQPPQQRSHADRFRGDVPDTAGSDGKARGGVEQGGIGGAPPSARGLSGDGLAPEWEAENPWAAGEPDVGRMAHGIPAQVDRLAALGDSLVPQIAEWIGRRILDYEQERMTRSQLQEAI